MSEQQVDAGASAMVDTTAAADTKAATTTTAGTVAGSAAGTDTQAATGSDAVPGGADSAAGADDAKVSDTKDWREPLAGGDQKFRDRLGRFATPDAFAKSYRALEQKLSSGEYKRVTPFPSEGSDQEKNAWRKEQGVPEKWEEYGDVKLAGGIVPGEKDKPVLDLFTQWAHKNNYSPDQRNAVIGAYYEIVDAQNALRTEADETHKTQTEDVLRTEFGANFRPYMNLLHSLQNQMPAGLADQLFVSRTPDGTVVGNDPRFIKWLVQLGLELNPAATLIPNAGGSPGKSVEGRLNEIRELRRNDPDKYDADKNLQAEEIQLLEAQQKMAARAA